VPAKADTLHEELAAKETGVPRQRAGVGPLHERKASNLCTPGTHVVMEDKLVRRHCTNSSSKTYHGDGWVTFEVEVRGNESIRHLVNGEVVLEYTEPQLDTGDDDAKRLLAAGAEAALSGGTISLQAESHSLDFRKVEYLDLKEK
jgi:hypothetical protein